MPQVTVYIREDDLDKWKSIEKKSDFVSGALNKSESWRVTGDIMTGNPNVAPNPFTPINPRDVVNETIREGEKMIRVTHDVVDKLTKIPGIKRASDIKTCKKHGTPLTSQGKCLQKGH